MPIRIALVSDVKSYLTGMKKANQANEDVMDSLDDLASEGADATDKLSRSFRELAKAGSKSAKDIGDDYQRGFKKADDGADEFKREADSTARESAASFDGSAESIADAFQEVSANAFAGFGPAGAAAGIAAAVGLGTAINALTAADEKMKELHEAASEFAQALRDAGEDEDALAEVLGARWQEFASQLAGGGNILSGILGEDVRTNAEHVVTLLESGTLRAHDLQDAFKSGTGEARLKGLRAAIDDLRAAEDRALRSGGLTPEQDRRYVSSVKLREGLEKLLATEEEANTLNRALAESEGMTVDQYRESTEAVARRAEVQADYDAALRSSGDAVGVYEDVLGRKEAAEQAAAEATAAATKDATDSWQDYADDVTVTTADLIAEWNAQAAAAAAFEANLATIAANGGQALADELRAKGPEVAAATAEVIAKSGPEEQRAAITAHAAATGGEVVRGMAAGLTGNQQVLNDAVAGAVKGIPVPALTIPVAADTTSLERSIKRVTDNVYQVYVQGKPVGNRYE